MKKILFVAFAALMLTGFNSFSQTTKSCQPTDCGPKGTKKAEAAVITDLRSELITLQKDLSLKPGISSNMPVLKEEELIRSTDSESLLIIAAQAMKLHSAMTASIPKNKLSQGFGDLEFNLQLEGAQLVSNLSKNLKIMKSQANTLSSL